MRSTSHCSPSGSIRTWSAPISTARRQTPESSWSRPTSTTPLLRAAPRTRRAASSPTRTSGAASQPPLRSGTPWWTSGRAPAAAHRRSRSSSSTASSVTINGPPCRPRRRAVGSCVMVPATIPSLLRCFLREPPFRGRPAIPARLQGAAVAATGLHMNGRYEPAKRTRQTEPAMNAAPSGARGNHGAAIPEIVWILVENCGQLDGCEYRLHPYRWALSVRLPQSSAATTHSDRSTGMRKNAAAARRGGLGAARKKRKTRPDMRRPPPGGRAGVVPTADSGGEESDRVSTVANDP